MKRKSTSKKAIRIPIIMLVITVIIIGIISTVFIGKQLTIYSTRYTITNGMVTEDGDFEYKELKDGTIEITKYVGTDTEAIIPNTIEGKSVTSIGDFAFSNCIDLISIEIPNGVTNVGRQSFYGCTSLIEIEIPEGVTSIGHYAFANCIFLENIILPETVENIGSRIFQKCIRLKSLVLPQNATFTGDIFFDSVLEILITAEENEIEVDLPEVIKRLKTEGDILYTEEEFTFKNCTINENNTKLIINKETLKSGNEIGIKINGGVLNDLTVRVMQPTITWDISKNENSNVNAIFDYKESSLKIEGSGEIENYYGGGPWQYLAEYIYNIRIEEGVRALGTWTFFDLDYVENINLPASLEIIGPYAFRGCSNLETIIIPEGTRLIGTGAFSSCEGLKQIEISSTVFAIGVEEVTLEWDEGMLEGTTITKIGEVFDKCTSLEYINVSSSNNFYSSAEGVLFDKEHTIIISYPAAKEGTEYEIPYTVKTIEAFSFNNCINLQTINIPENVEKIGEQAFYECETLENVILNEGLKKICNYAFYNTQKIESINIPASVEEIEEYALGNMKGLKNICVSEDNQTYSSKDGVLFNKEKTKLLSYPTQKSDRFYVVPDGVQEIYGFAYNKNLEYLELSNSVKKIGESTFADTKIKEIYIPDSVEEMCVFRYVGITFTPFSGSSDLIIYCNEGSYAEQFCITYNLEYTTEEFLSNELETIQIVQVPQKTTYIVGESFEKTGMVVIATYKYGNKKEVTEYTIIGGENLALGKTMVTISYTEKGITKTTTQAITVKEKEVTSLVVTTLPEKNTYKAHENFDSTGMIVTATYKDGSEEETTDYQIVGGNDLTCLVNKVEIQYSKNTDIKTEVEITVTHDEVIDEGKKATCTETGVTNGKHCAVCNKVLIKQDIIASTGHNYENGICTKCGAEESTLKIKSEIYQIQNTYISKIQEKTTVKTFKEKLQTNATEIKVYSQNGETQTETTAIATGMKVEVKYLSQTKTFTLVVSGDVDGDGKIKLSDMSIVNRYRLNKRKLEGEFFLAGDVNEDGKVDFKDLVKINRFRLHKITEL